MAIAVLAPNGTLRQRRPLPEHVDLPPASLRVDSHVADAQAGELAAADAGVGQQPNDRGVAPILESASRRTSSAARRSSSSVEHRHGLLGDDRRAHVGHRALGDEALFDGPLPERLQASGSRRSRWQARGPRHGATPATPRCARAGSPTGGAASPAGEVGVEVRERQRVDGLRGLGLAGGVEGQPVVVDACAR